MTYTATYSPEDNKLRLYASARLDKETYERVRAYGFKWAPKQDLFVAPMWTPQREDLLIELAGEIGDEDTSLVERQEQRAERFEEYSENRAADAETARKRVSAIADNIPFGQPILVGHHSEKHARRDAEKIENGMRKTVKMWEESKYWAERATAAIAHAKYKELPAVRARRIKGLEADERKRVKEIAECQRSIEKWEKVLASPQASDLEFVKHVAGQDHGGFNIYMALCFGIEQPDKTKVIPKPEDAINRVLKGNKGTIAWCERWLGHIRNRLTYERAMLIESGGTEADRVKPEVGGACQAWCSWRGGYSTIQKVNKVSVTLLDNWGNGGPDFRRTVPFDKLKNLLSKAQVDALREAGELFNETKRGFHYSPVKTKNEPTPAPEPKADAKPFEQIREQLKEGVKIVTAPSLFATPPEVAARMVQVADIPANARILEPSAGTGRILDALIKETLTDWTIPAPQEVKAVEINHTLAKHLRTRYAAINVQEGDFLECNGDLGKFDRILMNPPFEKGADIKHIKHATKFLKPGGRLVAICAGGPRQEEQLKPLAATWEKLPADTFKESGTGVNTVLLTIEGPEAPNENTP